MEPRVEVTAYGRVVLELYSLEEPLSPGQAVCLIELIQQRTANPEGIDVPESIAASISPPRRAVLAEVEASARRLYPELRKSKNATHWGQRIGDDLQLSQPVDPRTVKKTRAWRAAEFEWEQPHFGKLTRREVTAPGYLEEFEDRNRNEDMESRLKSALESLDPAGRESLKNSSALQKLFHDQQRDARSDIEYPR